MIRVAFCFEAVAEAFDLEFHREQLPSQCIAVSKTHRDKRDSKRVNKRARSVAILHPVHIEGTESSLLTALFLPPFLGFETLPMFWMKVVNGQKKGELYYEAKEAPSQVKKAGCHCGTRELNAFRWRF